MTLCRCTPFALAVGLLTSAVSPLPAQSARDSAERLIVMLDARFAGDAALPAFGSGIIVGATSGRLYIVTARHVVKSQGHTATGVTVRFRMLPGENFKATVLDFDDPGVDMAVLAVTDAPLSSIQAALGTRILRPDQPPVGEDLFYLGQPNGQRWTWNVTPAKFAELSDNLIRFEAPLITVGNSGGGVFDHDRRLVGMVVQDAVAQARAVPIGRIETILKSQQFPFFLTPKKDAAPPPPSQPAQQVSAPPPEQRTRTTVTIAYGGDPYSCSLNVQVRLGDRTVTPTSNSFTVDDVPLGASTYTVSGVIQCLTIGQCQVTGGGRVDIADNATLNFFWQNTGFARCTGVLRKT